MMILEKVIRLLSEVVSVDEDDFNASTRLTPEYGVEPIDLAKLVMVCEENFDLTIHDEDVHTFCCLGDLVSYIENILSEY